MKTQPVSQSSEKRSLQILSQVEVTKPCPASWREMKGDDRVRHCTHCAKNVYNISNMSRQEAADLIESTEGRVCVRYYTRPDGAIMTRDCGKCIRTQVRFMTIVATILGIFGLGSTSMAQQPPKQDGVKPKDYGVRRPRPIMGKVSHAMGGIARPVPHPIIANKPQGGDKAKVKESPLVRTPRGKDTAPHASGKSESKDHSTTNHA